MAIKYMCVCDRYDPIGDVPYESLDDFFAMCEGNGWELPSLIQRGEDYYEDGNKILEAVFFTEDGLQI